MNLLVQAKVIKSCLLLRRVQDSVFSLIKMFRITTSKFLTEKRRTWHCCWKFSYIVQHHC